jgi:PTH1 family peptidyl-tRNA hydrolase
VDTRHNIGFRVVERIAQRHEIELRRRARGALYGEGRIGDQRVTLILPQTFMNLSGHPVASYAAYFDIPPEDLIVIYDDADLELGRIRVRGKGSAGGHRGLQSVLECLGSQDFPRLRFGIGPVPPRWELADFVLSPFHRAELPVVEDRLIAAVQAVECWLAEGLPAAMNKYNSA